MVDRENAVTSDYLRTHYSASTPQMNAPSPYKKFYPDPMKLVLLQLAVLCCNPVAAAKKRGGKPRSVAASQKEEGQRVPIFGFVDARLTGWREMGISSNLDRIFSTARPGTPPDEPPMLSEFEAFNDHLTEIVNFLRFHIAKDWSMEVLGDMVATFPDLLALLALDQRSRDSQNGLEIPSELWGVYRKYSDFQHLRTLFAPVIDGKDVDTRKLFLVFHRFENFCLLRRGARERSVEEINRLIAGKLREFNGFLCKETGSAAIVQLFGILRIFMKFESTRAPDAEKLQKKQIVDEFMSYMESFGHMAMNTMLVQERLRLARLGAGMLRQPTTSSDEGGNLMRRSRVIVREFERLRFMRYCWSGDDGVMRQLARQGPNKIETMFTAFHKADYLDENTPEKRIIDMIFGDLLFAREAPSETGAATELEQSRFDGMLKGFYAHHPSLLDVPDDAETPEDAKPPSMCSRIASLKLR